MAVYVDNWGASFGRMTMCHMIADTHDELLSMVDNIGVPRKWIQKPNTHWEHFDICRSKRDAAVKEGAIAISAKELVRKMRDRRKSK